MNTDSNQYDKLRGWLDELVPEEFRDLIRSMLPTPQEQGVLSRSVEDISRGDFLGHMMARRRLDELEDRLKNKYPGRFPPPSSSAPPALHVPFTNRADKNSVANPTLRIPFTNREDEIKEIMIINSAPMRTFLISAPAGFGKSDLLEQLDKNFKQEGWETALVKTSRNMSLSELTHLLAKELGLTLPSTSAASTSWGQYLSSAWKTEFRKSKEQAFPGLVLLIDLDREPSLNLLENLLNSFIPEMQGNLKTLNQFHIGTSRLYIIIAGRSLEQLRARNIPRPLPLSPFDYNVIRRSTRNYMKDETEDTINQIAAHILYLTGGHPGCMAQGLQDYYKESLEPDYFLETFKENIWKSYVRQVVDKIDSEIFGDNSHLREIVEALSVFRYVDNTVLRHMLDKYKPENIINANDLQNKLASTHHFIKKGRYTKDAISRQLLIVRLRNENRQRLSQLCQDALKVCEERIINSPDPAKWVLEYLFQVLQQFSCTHVECQQHRLQLYNEFMNVHVPKSMEHLRNRQKSQEELRDNVDELLEEIKSDEEHWEFHFAVNYYLRGKHYTDQPLDDLKQLLSDIAERNF